MKQASRRQHGFALLLTLVLLMIAAVALSHVARQSTDEALNALDASESLQRRWAVTSCRATLLPRAQSLLADAAQGSVDEEGNPLPSNRLLPPGTDLRVSCELAGLSYDLVLTDEQAKYNPTVIGGLQFNDENLVNERALRAAVFDLSGLRERSAKHAEARVVLRPLIEVDADGKEVDPEQLAGEIPAVYGGYGQLFAGLRAAQLLGDADRAGAAANLTCWGDGRLNVKRAPDAVLKRVLSPVLGLEGTANLLTQRDENPGLGLLKLIDRLAEVTLERRAIAASLLTEHSQSQGLWVVAHGRARSWYTFSVRVYTPPSKLEEQSQTLPNKPNKTDKPDAEEVENAEPLPNPLQRYDYAW